MAVVAQFSFLDVGQGDCTVAIDLPSRTAIVIDCPAGQEHIVLDYLESPPATLHTGVITHGDADHSVGLLALIDRLGAEYLFARLHRDLSPAQRSQYRMMLSLCQRGKLKHKPLGAAQGRWRRGGLIDLQVLGPGLEVELSEAELARPNRNRTSLIVLLELSSEAGGQFRVLCMADADGVSVGEFVTEFDGDVVDVLRWPHHGASLGERLNRALLEAVRPRMVYAGAGSTNTYGHPSEETVRAVASFDGATMYCSQTTERDLNEEVIGTLVARVSDDGRVEVLVQRPV